MKKRTSFRVAANLPWLCAFFAATALATPIPPAQFTYDVYEGATPLAGCTPASGVSTGGTCGSELSGPGYAATSGGIGTASYLPVTAGGTALGTGTAVDAMSTGVSGSWNHSFASLTYSFEATGPSNVDFIPIDVLSSILVTTLGDGTAWLSMVISDSGTDDNIPHGVADPDPAKPLLSLTAFCVAGSCPLDGWATSGSELTNSLCVVNGDNYTISIAAATSAGPGSGNRASAVLDPEIKLDPPYPTNCSAPVSLDMLGLDTGPGASTGYAVPEPSTLDLAAIGVLALGCFGLGRRRAQGVRL